MARPRDGPAARDVPGSEPHPLRASVLPKHLVVTGYVVAPDGRRVLLLFHRKLQRWLPPGGHVEPGEDPLRALIREVWEETGLVVRPQGLSNGRDPGSEPGVLPLPTPHHVQVETIDGKHEHIDLAYFCAIVGGELTRNSESLDLRWFSEEDLALDRVGENVRTHALEVLGRSSPRPARARAPGTRSTVSTLPGAARRGAAPRGRRRRGRGSSPPPARPTRRGRT